MRGQTAARNAGERIQDYRRRVREIDHPMEGDDQDDYSDEEPDPEVDMPIAPIRPEQPRRFNPIAARYMRRNSEEDNDDQDEDEDYDEDEGEGRNYNPQPFAGASVRLGGGDEGNSNTEEVDPKQARLKWLENLNKK